MRDDPKVVLIGQMVTDVKGVFGTTLDAYREFPERCIEAPISETMLTGACVGMAMEGYKPVLVHARADWSTFSFEHLINTAAKLPFLHDKPMPWIMRVIVGRGWGQGPVHSQSFHHMLAQVPGLNVVVPASAGSYINQFQAALVTDGPTVIVEPRRLYNGGVYGAEGYKPSDITICPIGDTIIDAQNASTQLRTLGVYASVIPWEIMVENPVFCIEPPLLIVDMAPRRPEPGLVAPPFIPQGVSQVFEASWYPTSNDIVAEACRMLSVEPPEVQIEQEQFAPVGGPF